MYPASRRRRQDTLEPPVVAWLVDDDGAEETVGAADVAVADAPFL
jgi:hypothetical protein